MSEFQIPPSSRGPEQRSTQLLGLRGQEYIIFDVGLIPIANSINPGSFDLTRLSLLNLILI